VTRSSTAPGLRARYLLRYVIICAWAQSRDVKIVNVTVNGEEGRESVYIYIYIYISLFVSLLDRPHITYPLRPHTVWWHPLMAIPPSRQVVVIETSSSPSNWFPTGTHDVFQTHPRLTARLTVHVAPEIRWTGGGSSRRMPKSQRFSTRCSITGGLLTERFHGDRLGMLATVIDEHACLTSLWPTSGSSPFRWISDVAGHGRDAVQ